MSQTCAVDVWLVPLEDDPPIAFRSDADVLSEDEQLRAARFRFDGDRARWIRARSALRLILALCTGMPAPQIRFITGRYGKPSLVGESPLEFSLSHSGNWAMVAVTRGVPVGIDIERIRENVDMRALLVRLGGGIPAGAAGSRDEGLPNNQAELFNIWTRREAMTKAVGGALMEPPVGDLRLCDLDAPPGYAAALALIGHDPLVRRHSSLVLPAGTI